jgi:hypothetical protein
MERLPQGIGLILELTFRKLLSLSLSLLRRRFRHLEKEPAQAPYLPFGFPLLHDSSV